jgi:tetraspanin-33
MSPARERGQYYQEGRGAAVHPEQQARHRSRRRRIPSGFTYISGCVKYTMFFFNFIFWLMGLLLIGIGIYAIMDKWSSGEAFKLNTIFDVIFNVGFLLLLIGVVVFIVSFAGCIGALRENMCLLRFYSLCLLLFFLAEMTVIALGFIYPHKLTEFLEKELSQKLIQSYRDDLDFQNIIDLIQQDFECCGLSSEGYEDWNNNEYFNCTEENPSVEKCGVPYSCCHVDEDSIVPLNLMCGFEVQSTVKEKQEGRAKDIADVMSKINTRGCIETIQGLIENNLYTVGGIAIGIALSQLLVIWLARTLEGQIESQKALWSLN